MRPDAEKINAEDLAAALETYLAEHDAAVAIEDGKPLFYFREGGAKYALDLQHGRCVLQMWSEERNVVRRITGMRLRKQSLLLETVRMGQSKPGTLELTDAESRRAPSERKVERARYLRLLQRAAERHFAEWKLTGVTSAADLEHSLGPAYVRGELVRGHTSLALLAVGSHEGSDMIDGALTAGILWLALLRERAGNRRLVQGLRLIVPAGMAALAASRLAWMGPELAKWELWEFDEAMDELVHAEAEAGGNLSTRLLHAVDESRARERFATEIAQIGAILPACEVRVVSPSEIGFALHGMIFARARVDAEAGSFARSKCITFGAGANETPLTDDTEPLLRSLLARLQTSRTAAGLQTDPLFRMQAEAWLESEVRRDISALDRELEPAPVYSQMVAFAGAGDRGMLDLFARTRSGQLAVIELKAHEDMQLAMQGLDYWMRVRHLHRVTPQSEFTRMGYFAGLQLNSQEPALLLVAPALRIHPAVEVVLRHLSPRVPWQLIAVDERWRSEVKVVWRKRSHDSRAVARSADSASSC